MLKTTTTKRGLRIAGVAALVASAGAVGIAAAQSVDVSECVKLSTPEERLACFEAQVDAAEKAPPGAAAAAPPAAAAADGGFRESRQADEDPPDIVAKVTELRETVPNAYRITLDNGQIWRQTVPEAYPLREGSDVRIYMSRWRAWRLTSAELKGFIQVERLR